MERAARHSPGTQHQPDTRALKVTGGVGSRRLRNGANLLTRPKPRLGDRLPLCPPGAAPLDSLDCSQHE